MQKAIIIDHLSYLNDLKNISFTIQSGEMVGIIGPKDSGKTTLFKIISGLLKTTSGFVSVLDYDPYLKNYDFLKQISSIDSSNKNLLDNLPPIEILEITKEIYGLSNRDFNKNLNELTKYIKDPHLLDSLIYKPKIVLSDDAGRDLNSLYEYNNKNQATILIASENLDSLINLVRRVIIIDEGEILFDGAIDEIISKYANDKIIRVKLSSEIDVKIVEEIGTLKKYVYPNLYISSPRPVVSFAAAELLQNLPITSLNIEELSVEEIIKNMKS